MIKLFPCLGEFTYQKILAVTIMKSVNNFLNGNGYMPIAVREMQHECAKIESARSSFLMNNNNAS